MEYDLHSPTQVDELKHQSQQQQTAVEDRRRLESNSARDIKDVGAMLRGEACSGAEAATTTIVGVYQCTVEPPCFYALSTLRGQSLWHNRPFRFTMSLPPLLRV